MRDYRDPVFRAKISAAFKGVPKSPAHRAAISAALTGIPHPQAPLSPEAKAARSAKISAALTGRRRPGRASPTDATRAKISAAMKGHAVSPETRAKISAFWRERRG